MKPAYNRGQSLDPGPKNRHSFLFNNKNRRNSFDLEDSHASGFRDSIAIAPKTVKRLNEDYNIYFGSTLKINHESQTISYRENEIFNERYVKFERIYRVMPVHYSLAFGNRNSFRILTKEDSGEYASIIFNCNSQQERDNKIRELLQYVDEPDDFATQETTLKISVKEARNLSLRNRYYCDIKLDDILYARTSVKEMREMLFWGEEFDLKGLPRIETISLSIWKMPRPKDKYKFPQVVSQVNICPSDLNPHVPTDKWYSPSPITIPSHANSNITAHLKFSVACNLDAPPDSFRNENNNMAGLANNSNGPIVKDTAPLLRLSSCYFPLTILRCTHLYQTLISIFQNHSIELLEELNPYVTAKYREQLVSPIVRIAIRQQWIDVFLAKLIAQEAQNSNINLILRGNSMGSKAIECFLKLECQNYLRNILNATIHEIEENYPSLEIDRQRLRKMKQSTSTAALAKRQKKLEEIVSNVLNRIFSLVNEVPKLVQRVFQEIRNHLMMNGITDQEFLNKVVSACLFLRLICPAIMTPYLFNLVPEYSENQDLHRAFTLVAKCVQNVANFASIDEMKEDYMKDMVIYCRNFYGDMQGFLQNISTKSQLSAIKDNDAYTDSLNYARTSSYYKDSISYDAARLSYHLTFVVQEFNIIDTSSLMNQVKSVLVDIKRQEHQYIGLSVNESLDTIDQLKINVQKQAMATQRHLEISTKSSGYFSTIGLDALSMNLCSDGNLGPDNKYNLDRFNSLLRAQESKSGSLADILELEQEKLSLIRSQSNKIRLFKSNDFNTNNTNHLSYDDENGKENSCGVEDEIDVCNLTSLNVILSSKKHFRNYLNYAENMIQQCLDNQLLTNDVDNCPQQHDKLEQIMKMNPTIQMALLKMMDN